MRGKEDLMYRKDVMLRITPAYAGKSDVFVFWRVEPEDHPRVCGEKFHYLYYYGYNKGSPPRMRGKASQFIFGLVSDGITPAYAGKR